MCRDAGGATPSRPHHDGPGRAKRESTNWPGLGGRSLPARNRGSELQELAISTPLARRQKTLHPRLLLRTLLVMSLLDRFAGSVRRLRSKKGLSQKALADTIGISVSYVSMLERGQRSPPLETVEKIARALKVTPAALLGGR